MKREKTHSGTISKLISFEEAAELLGGINSSTIRQRKGGTEGLTHVRGFGRRVFLIRSEVLALVDRKIAQAEADNRALQRFLR